MTRKKFDFGGRTIPPLPEGVKLPVKAPAQAATTERNVSPEPCSTTPELDSSSVLAINLISRVIRNPKLSPFTGYHYHSVFLQLEQSYCRSLRGNYKDVSDYIWNASVCMGCGRVWEDRTCELVRAVCTTCPPEYIPIPDIARDINSAIICYSIPTKAAIATTLLNNS
jgi:hypothetical protein